jgi:hypothetical protein
MVPMDGVLVAIGSFGALGLHFQRVDLPWCMMMDVYQT